MGVGFHNSASGAVEGDNCEPDGVPGPMVVLPKSIKNWGDCEHDGIDCAVRVIPGTFANGYISFDLDCRGTVGSRSREGRCACGHFDAKFTA